MKKLFLILIAATSLLMAGCNKENERVSYIIIDETSGNYESRREMFHEMWAIVSNFENSYVNKVDYVISQMDAVFEKYNNKDIEGTLTLKSSDKIKESDTLKTWTFVKKSIQIEFGD